MGKGWFQPTERKWPLGSVTSRLATASASGRVSRVCQRKGLAHLLQAAETSQDQHRRRHVSFHRRWDQLPAVGTRANARRDDKTPSHHLSHISPSAHRSCSEDFRERDRRVPRTHILLRASMTVSKGGHPSRDMAMDNMNSGASRIILGRV